MKKALLYASMAFVALCVACNISELEISIPEEDSNTVPEGYKSVTVSATKDDAQSKTSYAGEQTFAWSDGDQISVWCTDASVPANTGFYTFTTSTGGSASATFTGTIPGTAVVGDVALYPANASHSYADGKYHFQVAGEKSYIGATQSADIPMYGVNGGSSNFSFTQMTGAVKFTVNNIPAGVTQVKFTFTAATSKLSGSFDVTTSSPYTWSTSSTETASEKAIVRYCPVTSNAFSVYVPYTEGTIWGDNTLLIQDYTGDSVGSTLYTQSNIGAIPVTRNKVTKLSTLSCEYRSAYGVDWSGISESTNASGSLKSMKATMDEDYFYILLGVKTSDLNLTKEHSQDHYIRIYVGDNSGSKGNWGEDQYYKQITANVGGSTKDTQAWAVVNGNLTFNLSSNREMEAHVTTVQNTSYYEIVIPRTSATAIYSALTPAPPATSVKIGVTLDNYWHKDDGNVWASSSSVIGMIPASGEGMYNVPLYVAPGSVAATAPGTVAHTYHESLTETVNPERGMYRHNEYHFGTRDASPAGAASVDKVTVSCESDKTLVETLFYMYDYINSENITSSVTNAVDNVLSNVRAAGKKAIIRFAYNDVYKKKISEDPLTYTYINPREPRNLSYVTNHIDALASVLNKNKDVIYLVQAGFIGTYGEWYYTTDDGGTTAFPFSMPVSANAVSNFENRATVLDHLLDAVPEGIQIALRTPKYKNFYLHPTCVDGDGSWDALSSWDWSGDADEANHRLSFHNDALFAGADDMGTFRSAPTQDRTMWQSQGDWLAIGGEVAFIEGDALAAALPYYQLSAALPALKTYRYSYLNDASSNDEIIKYWIANDQYPIIRKALGYRLVLNSMSLTAAELTSGSTISVSFNISNVGSASVIYPRPCKLVLLHNGTPTVLTEYGTGNNLEDLYDIRDIKPDQNHTYSMDVQLPQDVYKGDKLAIWMPDKTAGLQGTAAYSIRLSNYDVEWDNGYNVIHTF